MHESARVRGERDAWKFNERVDEGNGRGWKARNVIRCFLPRRNFDGRKLKKNENIKRFYYSSFFERKRERENAHVLIFFLFIWDRLFFFLFLFFDGCRGARFNSGSQWAILLLETSFRRDFFEEKNLWKLFIELYCCINNFLNNTFFHSWIGENFRVNYFPFVEKLYGM